MCILTEKDKKLKTRKKAQPPPMTKTIKPHDIC